MKTNEQLQYLLDRYINKTCTLPEKQELMQLLSDPSYESQWNAINEVFENVPQLQHSLNDASTQSAWDAIRERTIAEQPAETAETIVRPMYRRWWAAAVLLVLVGASWFLWFKPEQKTMDLTAQVKRDSILPGQAGAILKLEDGSVIVLDSVQNAVVASNGAAKAIVENGSLAYEPLEITASPEAPVFNTMVTMRGKQYKMTLPDGTKVWLNASTQFRYPTAFYGKERRVRLSGEAYFEVVKDAAKPFIVEVEGKGDVQVLGTQFNVNAYSEDDRFITTLLEGKVRTISMYNDSKGRKQQVTLSPSFQSIMQQNKDMIVKKADLEQTMAWKDGKFVFKSAALSEVFSQLGRWYDVNFVDGEKMDEAFSGSMYRTDDFYQMLKLIEFTSNVNCKVEGRTVIVTSKK